MKNFLLGVLAVIFIGLIGFFTYQAGKRAKGTTTSVPTPTEQMVGNDKDVHGCIGSAGYSWCPLKQKCLRIWEEPCSETTVMPTSIILVPTIDETALLKTAIMQALVAEHGSSANTLTITVSKIEGNFATGGASSTGGGGMWLAAKVNGNWKLVWNGNGTISCQETDPYNFPVSLLPECYDTVNEKVRVR